MPRQKRKPARGNPKASKLEADLARFIQQDGEVLDSLPYAIERLAQERRYYRIYPACNSDD